jgi:hypothetical protein
MTRLHQVTNLLLVAAVSFSNAFQIQSQSHQRYRPLHMSSSNSGSDFAFQEMRVQLDAMKRNKIPSRDLPLDKRQELEQYVNTVVSQRPSPVALKDIGAVLPGTKWRLGFSTEAATLGDLPRDAEVNLEFINNEKMDYVLEFSKKTLGLNRLTAKSSYTVDVSDVCRPLNTSQCLIVLTTLLSFSHDTIVLQSSPVNPGLVTFVYEDITTDVFGFSNLGVGFFGLLKGRANYVESAYFDGRFWIERGTSPEGQTYYNVYVRNDDGDMDEWGS